MTDHFSDDSKLEDGPKFRPQEVESIFYVPEVGVNLAEWADYESTKLMHESEGIEARLRKLKHEDANNIRNWNPRKAIEFIQQRGDGEDSRLASLVTHYMDGNPGEVLRKNDGDWHWHDAEVAEIAKQLDALKKQQNGADALGHISQVYALPYKAFFYTLALTSPPA